VTLIASPIPPGEELRSATKQVRRLPDCPLKVQIVQRAAGPDPPTTLSPTERSFTRPSSITASASAAPSSRSRICSTPTTGLAGDEILKIGRARSVLPAEGFLTASTRGAQGGRAGGVTRSA